MTARLRLAAIRALDWLDDALGHPSMRLCAWIAMNPWWDASGRGRGVEGNRKLPANSGRGRDKGRRDK